MSSPQRTSNFNNVTNLLSISSSIPLIPRTTSFLYLHPKNHRLTPLEWGLPWSDSSSTRRLSSRPHFPFAMSVPLAHDLMQWSQPVDNPSAEWRRLASSSYVDANPSPGSVSTPVEIRQVETSVGDIINVPINRLGECLPPISVFAYFDRYPGSFDASRFRHGMRLSGHLTEICIGGDMRLTCAGGWMKRWLHWGGRGAAVYRSSSDRTDSPFIRMDEEVDYERRLSVMIARYVRWIDTDDFDSSSLVVDMDLCCMDRPLDYCWFMSFSATWREQLDFEVRLRQVHSDPRARVLLGWQNVEVFAVRPSERVRFYVGVDAFDWGSYSGHRFLLIPTPPVFSYYSRLAFESRYRPLLHAVALTEFGACAFLRVLYTAYRGVPSTFGKPTSLRVGRPALLPLSPALLDVIRRLNPLTIVHGTEYDAAQSLVALNQLTCIDWSALGNADPGGEPWVYYDLETGVASTPLLPQVPYHIQPVIDFTTASRLADDYFRSPTSSARSTGAPENSTNIEVVEVCEPHLADSSTVPFSLGPPVVAPSVAIDPRVQPSVPASVVVTRAATSSSVVPVPSAVVQPSTAMASQIVGSPSILAPPSSPGAFGVPPAASAPRRSQLPHVVPSRSPSVGALDATITGGVSLARQLTTVKRQRDAARRDLATVTDELHKVRDENDELRSALAVLRDAFQVSRSSLVDLMSKCDSVFAQLPPTDNVDDETS